MSDSEFEDLASSSATSHLVQEVNLRNKQIQELKMRFKDFQAQMKYVEKQNTQCNAQLEKKNCLLKSMAGDNIQQAKKVAVQEMQIVRLKEELLLTEKSLHEALTEHLSEKAQLLSLNNEFSENLVKNEEFLAAKIQEFQEIQKQNVEKSQLIKQMEIRLKELQNNKLELQKANKNLSESEAKLNHFIEIQKQLIEQKKLSQSLREQIKMYKNDINILQKQNKRVHENMSKIKQEKSILSLRVMQLQKQVSEQQNKAIKRQDEMNQLLQEFESLGKRTNELQSELKVSIQENMGLKVQIQAIKLQKQKFETQVTLQKAKQQQISQQLTLAKAQSQTIQQKLTSLQQQLAKKANKIHQLIQNNTKSQSQLLTIKSATQKTFIQNQQLYEMLQKKQEQIKQMKQKMQLMNDKRRRQKSGKDNQIAVLKELQAQLNKHQQFIKNTNNFSIDANNDTKTVQKRCKQLQKEVDEHIDTIEVIYKQCQSLRREVQQLKSINQIFTQTNNQVNQTNKQLNENLLKVRKQLKLKEEQNAVILKEFQEHLIQFNNHDDNKFDQKNVDQCSVQTVIQMVKQLKQNIQEQIAALNQSQEEKQKIVFVQKEKLLKDIKSAIFSNEKYQNPKSKQLVRQENKKQKVNVPKKKQKQIYQDEDSQISYNKFKGFDSFSN